MKAPGYVDAGRALIEEHGGHRFAYGAWDRVFGCWVARNGESAREVVPFWPVLDSQGGLARDVANRRACRVQMEAVEPCDTLALNWHGLWPEWLRAPRLSPVAAAALERFISRIPEAHRRRAAPYGAWPFWTVSGGCPDLPTSSTPKQRVSARTMSSPAWHWPMSGSARRRSDASSSSG